MIRILHGLILKLNLYFKGEIKFAKTVLEFSPCLVGDFNIHLLDVDANKNFKIL